MQYSLYIVIFLFIYKYKRLLQPSICSSSTLISIIFSLLTVSSIFCFPIWFQVKTTFTFCVKLCIWPVYFIMWKYFDRHYLQSYITYLYNFQYRCLCDVAIHHHHHHYLSFSWSCVVISDTTYYILDENTVNEGTVSWCSFIIVVVFIQLIKSNFQLQLLACVFIMPNTHLEGIWTLRFPECQGTPCSNKSDIWGLSDFNEDRTHNHLVYELTLNHLTKLAKWLSCVVSTDVYNALTVCVSYHICVYS